ncbi:hypothetical protein D3C87_961300 [compost metagenome]
MQAAVDVFLGDRNDQTQVGDRHFAFRVTGTLFAGSHLLVDLAQVSQRQGHARLQVDHLLLQFLDGRHVAAEDGAVRILAIDFAVDPFQVAFIAWEHLDEVGARHAAFVHAQFQHGALDVAHFFHLAAQGVAQLFHDLGREADAQQFLRNGFLRLDVGFRVVTLGRLAHLVVLRRNDVEFLQRILFQLRQLLARETGRAAIGVAVFFLGFLFLFLVVTAGGGRRGGSGWCRGIAFVQIDEAVDHFIDLDFVARDFLRQRDDFADRGRAGGNGLDHVFQAAFDALGDLDLAFARQQRHGAHFTHVHAHGVGGAAEVGVDGRQGGRGSRFHFIVAGDGGDVVSQQQAFRVRSALVDGDTHVVESGDDAFDRFRIDDVFRQLVIDLGIGEEAAFLAHVDQARDLLAAAFQVRCRCFRIAQCIGQAALGLAVARFRHGLQFGAFDGVQCRHFIVFRREFAWFAATAAWHLDRWQEVIRGIDGGQGIGVRGLADHLRAGDDGHGRRFRLGAHDFRTGCRHHFVRGGAFADLARRGRGLGTGGDLHAWRLRRGSFSGLGHVGNSLGGWCADVRFRSRIGRWHGGQARATFLHHGDDGRRRRDGRFRIRLRIIDEVR